jgi:2-polyprenyl-3-methyl-5-hydroxy-6-metoxy-1,4-benzoquinol methylase
MSLIGNENTQAKDAWDRNAEFWNERMGEGNDFFNILLWPAVERLLKPQPGERLLDVACGNGLTSRRLATAKARVTAIDVSAAMIAIAAGNPCLSNIDYRVVDATDRGALLGRGVGAFDGALCNMALMDMAEIEPLMTAVAVLLKPGGRFLFSVLHPCFNNPATIQMGELQDRNGALVTTYSVKIARYKTPFTQVGLAMHGQPVPHPYFHRPGPFPLPARRCGLSLLLAPALSAGLVLDGFEEQAFPADNSGGTTPLSWSGRFSEIPAALVVRLRRTT